MILEQDALERPDGAKPVTICFEHELPSLFPLPLTSRPLNADSSHVDGVS